ncbi:hypothetical protein Efla_007709 [Eimeria flavescens]
MCFVSISSLLPSADLCLVVPFDTLNPGPGTMLRLAAKTLVERAEASRGAPLLRPLLLEAPRALQSIRRSYMGPRKGSSSSSSNASTSNASNATSSSSSNLPAASFSIFTPTSMVTIRPSPPTLDSVPSGASGGAPPGTPPGPPQTFLREGGIIFSFLPKLASNKTFDKAARITVLLKARHVGHLLLPPAAAGGGGPHSSEGLSGSPSEDWELEAPCGAGYSLRVTPHSTKPHTHVCIALLQQQPEPLHQQQQQQQQGKRKAVHVVACPKGEWQTLQLLLQHSVPLLFNWTSGALQAAAEEEMRANAN